MRWSPLDNSVRHRRGNFEGVRSHFYGRALLALSIVSFLTLTSRAEKLPIKIYTTAEGLSNNAVNKIVRDSRGFLWFCTEGGLSRFDGYTFTNFSTDEGLPHPNVNTLIETRAGDYWIGTNGGLVHFDPKGVPANVGVSGASIPMFALVEQPDKDRAAQVVNTLFEDAQGTIWCGTFKGVFRLDQSSNRYELRSIEIGIPKDYPEQGLVSSITQDSYGSLWFGVGSGLYRHWADGSAARYTRQEGLPDDDVQDLLLDHLGQLWVGTRDGGFFRVVFDEGHKAPVVAESFSVTNGLTTNWVFQLFETAEKRFWIATNQGLREFDPASSESRFRSYTTKNGLIFHDITALAEDLAGNLWMGTYAGAMKLARNGFVTYDEQDGVYQVNAVFEDRNGLVGFRGYRFTNSASTVGSSDVNNEVYAQRFAVLDKKGLSWFSLSAITPKTLGWVAEDVTLQARNGEWWIGGVELYRFPSSSQLAGIENARPLQIFSYQHGLTTGQVYRLFEDSTGNIWVSMIGQGNGLALWEPTSQSLRSLSNEPGLPPIKDNLPRAFAEDAAGDVWIGFSTGVARYRNGAFSFFNRGSGLPSGTILNIFRDHAGQLWLASSGGGLIRVDDPTAESPQFSAFTTLRGLSSNIVLIVTEDSLGHIYAGTGRGLDRLDPKTGHVNHFTTADGLASGTLLSAFCDRSGTLWVGTTKGLSRLAPQRNDSISGPPPILISGVRVAGAKRLVSALGETDMQLTNLGTNQNDLQIEFVGLGFAPGDTLRYQYRLSGADWSAPSEERTVNFVRLRPGNYRFEVRAINSDGMASTKPATISFIIPPPFWLRWWFLTLTALAAGLVVYTIYRYRVRRLLEVANMRTRIATDLHDDIGANLTKIAILSEVAKQQTGGNTKEDSPLHSIARISRESVASMNDIVWAIDPQRDHLVDLVRRMRREAEELFAARDIDLTFLAPGEEQDLRLGVNVRRDLFLIFKEAINNAARHSQSHQVTIEFRVDPRLLALRITDDGTGFDLNADDEGHGLENMRQRAAGLGGELKIDTGAGKGTIIDLKVPRAQSRRLFGEKSAAHPV